MNQELAKIHEASLQILETTGVRFFHPQILSMLKKKGVKVNGETAFFSPSQVEEWIKKAPAVFSVYARNPQYNILLGGETTEFAAGYGAPIIIDQKGMRRKAKFDDYLNFLKLIQQCPFFNINGGILVQPADIGSRHGYPSMLFATLAYSDKCLMGGAGGAEEVNIVLDMLDIVFGRESLMTAPRILAILNSTSPLQFDKDTLDTLLLFAEYGQPVIITPAVMAGTTGPITIAGTLALSNAEILAGITVAQMIREGTPVMYGMQSTAADMRTGGIADGSPERAICVAYGARLAKEYGIPYRGGGTENDAKSLSVQSGYESMLDILVACQEQTNLIIHSAGTLDSHGAMSYEKFIVDLEILGMVKRLLQGLNTAQGSLGVKLIKSFGHGAGYSLDDQTRRLSKEETYTPFISLKGSLPEGATPEQELLNKINSKKEEMLAQYCQPELSPKVLTRLKAYLASKEIETAILK
ncbi:trimethylamine methyltransferase family protein [Desulfosporosinus sp. PR]|uniref:trimethylamine methyltransferase family protein n=1 Tax=Candidatus Desulfosporosinus nitrosoreducens TaxID=3401928 RepID=UPI0027E5F611|nr:trimethylamine methyltransferase family protein [Desulfosporosinus sp. PR]MDQ7095138.1 trimethylamine methyltransferase family protein [Desulfosporosinus sp. PR]